MINSSAIKKFAIQFGLALILFFLVGTNLNVHKKFTDVYANRGNALFKKAFSQKTIKFKRVKNQDWLVKIDVVNKKAGKKKWCTLNIWGIFYLPFVLFLSLIIATPFKKWISKFSSFAISFFLLLGYFYVCLNLKIIYLFNAIEKTEPGFSSSIYYDMIDKVNTTFIDNANVYLITVVIIWFLVVVQSANFDIKNLQ